ncbi:hypothetical protein [Maribacter sp. 2308TA10-17]|uniref:hypothetical protein n=1 Tax=Maribacter sp. 2308TA10-17 TaxID=3386276 RepID=UPI0039BD7120
MGKDKLLRYNGGIAANAVYYDGTANRQALTYFLTGNLNFNIAGLYNIPLSFTYSNQDFNFPNPFKFNRLSLNPSYKWVAAHIGDANMTFSPYTLSGHQFTGVGVDLTPEGPFQISAMYGRFLRATEYNEEEPQAITAYKRTGYGIKTSYDFEKIKLGLILFQAKDEESSLENPFPVEIGLAPKENTVVSFESEFRLFEKAQFRFEYAISGVTEDTRLTEARSESGLLSFLLNENITTNYYNAFNASFNYPAGNGVLGVGYERIDPDYKTLGAYFFNNDLENITINASQSIFDNKLNVSVNAGLQQDNLDKTKSSDLQRIVASVNLNYTASERLGINGSYSNFQSYTNIQDQFDYINQVGAFDNVDTLNYRQISQNANLGVNLITKKTESKQHSANLNLVYQNSDNQQQGETIEGGNSSFYNGMLSHTWGFPNNALNISLAANTSYNRIGIEDKSLTFGPTLAVSKQFFDKKLRTNFSSSYNTAFNNGEQQNNIYNFRLGATYVWLERHNFNLNALSLFRNTELANSNDFTLTFGYSYAFDNFKLKFKKREKVPSNQLRTLSFRHRGVTYNGTMEEINTQLTNVYGSSKFASIPTFKKGELNQNLSFVKEQRKEEPYKESAIIFLEELYSYEDFLKLYDQALYEVILKVQEDMLEIDMALEKLFVIKKLELDAHPLKNKSKDTYTKEDKSQEESYLALITEEKDRLEKLVGHRWMQNQFNNFTSKETIERPIGYLLEFKRGMSEKAYLMYEKEPDLQKLKLFLENEIIDFYYKKSLGIVNPETFELKYINKN